MVGADTCGFSEWSAHLSLQPRTTPYIPCKVGNSDEELCNRWMQLSAFAPFYRNHNIRAAIGQEPYRWDSVAKASRDAIAIRYALLPYWVGVILLPFDFSGAELRTVHPVCERFNHRDTARSRAVL